MNKLAAVNRVLTLLGQPRAVALATGSINLAGHIERDLDASSELLQTRGWHFNKRYRVTLERDEDNKIPVPADTLSIDTDGASGYLDVTVQDGFLFDLGNEGGSDVFTGDVTVDLIKLVAWDSLPAAFQELVCVEAAIAYNRAKLKEAPLEPMLEKRRQYAEGQAKRHELNTTNTNLLETEHARAVRGRPRLGGRF